MERELRAMLVKILDDARGDLKNPTKRVWPIRAANYREATALLLRGKE
jgi:hypothetical protein